jgi:putative Holliday junction resolvase
VKPKRLLCLDIGEKRIGLAIAEVNSAIAKPLTTINRSVLKQDLQKISQIISEQQVVKVIVGYPLTLSGKPGIQAKITDNFVYYLENSLKISVERFDERFSSKLAMQSLKKLKLRREKMREIADQVAASIILQDYLDHSRQE